LLRVQRNTPDNGQKNCPKYAEFYSKNKFEELVYLVGFIIRMLSRCQVKERMEKWEIGFKCFQTIVYLLFGR